MAGERGLSRVHVGMGWKNERGTRKKKRERGGEKAWLRVCLVWVGMAGCAVVRDCVHRTGAAVVGGGGGAEERNQ